MHCYRNSWQTRLDQRYGTTLLRGETLHNYSNCRHGNHLGQFLFFFFFYSREKVWLTVRSSEIHDVRISILRPISGSPHIPCKNMRHAVSVSYRRNEQFACRKSARRHTFISRRSSFKSKSFPDRSLWKRPVSALYIHAFEQHSRALSNWRLRNALHLDPTIGTRRASSLPRLEFARA